MEPVPIDQARLRPHLRGGREKGELPVAAALDDVLEAEAELVRRQPGRVVVPSLGELRGLPALGWGVGVQPGRQPERTLLAKEQRRRPVVDALQVRAAAAHDLARKGLLDGAIALSYVLWPSEAVEAASCAVAAEGAVHGRHSERTRLRALELVDAGASWAETARLVNVPKQTVGTWVRKRQGRQRTRSSR
jgi:hypothetical protein